jgi:hypothetical protein
MMGAQNALWLVLLFGFALSPTACVTTQECGSKEVVCDVSEQYCYSVTGGITPALGEESSPTWSCREYDADQPRDCSRWQDSGCDCSHNLLTGEVKVHCYAP